jgi:hypothetical protein
VLQNQQACIQSNQILSKTGLYGWHNSCIQRRNIDLFARKQTGVSKVHSYNKTVLAGAVLLALSGAAVQAQPSSEIKSLKSTVEELRKQLQELKSVQRNDAGALEKARVDELRKQVEELRAVLKKQVDDKTQQATTAAAAAPTEEESQAAQDARTAASKADVQGLRTDLENYKYDQSRLQERNIPSVTRNTKIGGSITLGYATQNPATPPTTTSGTTLPAEPRKSGFTPAVAGLNFAGNLYRDYEEGKNLTYRLAFTTTTNFGTSGSFNSTGQSSTSNSSGTQFNLTDAYLSYSFQPVTGNAEDPIGTLTLGQQIIPFGQDAQAIDPEVKAVIGNAGFVAGLGLNARQVGLVLKGDYDPYVDYTNNYRAPLVAYSLGVVNGSGPNKQDNNSLRDWVGRAVFTLPVDYASWFRQLQIGTSIYRGYKALGTAVTSAVDYKAPSTGLYTANKGTSDRYGFDVNWTHLPFSISYEWAYGKDQQLATAANGLIYPDFYQRGVGQYVNFGYTWGEQFLNSSKQQGKFDDYWPKSYQAFVRLDSWDPNRSSLVLNDHVYVTTVGLNAFFAETSKFQINYLHTRNQLGTTAPTLTKPRSSNGIQAQFNATF